jgi:hypothetical protein
MDCRAELGPLVGWAGSASADPWKDESGPGLMVATLAVAAATSVTPVLVLRWVSRALFR